MIPSYLLPLRISRATNLVQSSTINLILDIPLTSAFSFAQAVIPLEASTWHTFAPAFAHATEAPPVYAKRLRTLTGRPAFLMVSSSQSQLQACSGKSPRMLKAHRLKPEPKPSVINLKNLWKLFNVPLAAARI